MRTIGRAGLVALAFAFLTTACLPAATPAPENGRLPDSMLTTVTPTCRVVNDVAPRLEALLAAAASDGYGSLVPETQSYTAPLPSPPQIESCYRSYDGQVWWRNFYCFFGNCAMAAVPGTSVHGWGRAVDFEYAGREMTFDSPGYAWLFWNAGRFGFTHPAWAEPGQPGAEPWHWEAS